VGETGLGTPMYSLEETEEPGSLRSAAMEIEEEIKSIIVRATKAGTLGKAPNGEKSNLNDRQWAMVRTKAFKEWFGDWEIESYNSEMNRRLSDYQHGKLAKEYIFRIGKPSSILKAAGVPDNEITIFQNVITKASSKHGIKASDLVDIARNIQAPLAVFDSATVPGAKVVLTEIKKGDRHIIAAMHLVKLRGSLAVNDIKSIHARPEGQIYDWIDKGLLRSLDKEKGQWLLEREGRAIRPMTSTPTFENLIYHDSDSVKPSSVVDENGEPLVVYHGSFNDFYAFDLGFAEEEGFFFTPDKSYAKEYGHNIMRVFLAIKSPYEVTPAHWLNDFNESREELLTKGYDGIKIKGTGKTGDFKDDIYVAFSPTQIKSATGNVGTFSNDNPDIRYSLADDRETIEENWPEEPPEISRPDWSPALEKYEQHTSSAALMKHPDYDAAKRGDLEAARRVADKFFKEEKLTGLVDNAPAGCRSSWFPLSPRKPWATTACPMPWRKRSKITPTGRLTIKSGR